jgi:hypothetical protein
MPDAATDTANATASAPPIETTESQLPSQLEEPNTPAPTKPQVQLQPVPVVPPHVGRLAQFGHLASSLLGKQYDYQVDPKTGQTIQTEIKQKPGDVFRHIVAGAILGGALGAGADPAKMPAGEVAKAGGPEANDQRRAQAQKQFENQTKVRTEDREDTLTKAQIAHMHVQDLHADAQMDLMQQEHIDKQNQFNNSVLDVAKEKGTPSRILVNGTDINATQNKGKAFAAAYTKNPRAFDAPEGYYRIHSQTVDNSGLTYKVGTGWVDAEGKPVDMAERTTHHFYDIPKSVMSEHIQKTGKEWNSIAGYKAFPDDDKMHDGTLQDLMGLKTAAVKNSMEQNKADLERQQIKLEMERVKLESQRVKSEVDKGNRTDMLAAYESNKLLIDSARARLKDAEFGSPEEKKQAIDDLNEATSNMKYIQEKLYPKTAVPAKPGGAPAGNAKFDIPTLQKQIPDANWPNVIKSGMTVVANPFTGTVKALFPDDAKAALSKGAIEVPVPDKFKSQPQSPNFEAAPPM